MKKALAIIAVALILLTSSGCTLLLLQAANSEKDDTIPGHFESNYEELPEDQPPTGSDAVAPPDIVEAEWENEWHRTDVVRALDSTLKIENADESGFDFDIFACYYSHTGEISGRAKMLSETRAVYYYDDYNYLDEEKIIGEVYFEISGDKLNISTVSNKSTFGLGRNVSLDGEYIVGEPVYTNATVLEDNFSEETLDRLEALLGENYDYYFVTPTTFGVFQGYTTVSEGSMCSAWTPTMGDERYELLMGNDGYLYYYNYVIGYYTENSGAPMPECLGQTQ